MKISSIIAEFNPFHRGHSYIIEEMKAKSDAIVCVMSGNFVQRGECAIFEKYERARAAVENGVDLVIELPLVYALSSAEGFSYGGVKILDECKIIDDIYFGSECGDIEKIKKVANALKTESTEYKERLNTFLSEGMSDPKARMLSLKNGMEEAHILENPNNILAVEYLRALEKVNSEIVPHTIKRKGSGYNDTEIKGNIPSATILREMIKRGDSSNLSFDYTSKPLFMDDLDIVVSARLKTIAQSDLEKIPDCNSEIAVRLKNSSKYNTVADILEEAACKRYTQSRLRRILCNMVISNEFKALPEPTYIRPIAFNNKGAELLKQIKKAADLPVADRGAILKNDEIFKLECRGSDIAALLRNQESGSEFVAAR